MKQKRVECTVCKMDDGTFCAHVETSRAVYTVSDNSTSFHTGLQRVFEKLSERVVWLPGTEIQISFCEED